jgi:tetrahydromethanopterin S-methyltransferase subunit F
MNKFYLISVTALLFFSLINNSDAMDSNSTVRDINYQADHDLYIDQTVTGKGQRFEMADDATGVTDAARVNGSEDETVLAASIVKVSATTRTGIMIGMLSAVLLVSGSLAYWRMRRMDS